MDHSYKKMSSGKVTFSRDEKRVEHVTAKEWVDMMKDFAPEVRYHAANLAAHNWNVVMIYAHGTEYLMISNPFGEGHFIDKAGTRTTISEEEYDVLYPTIPYSKETLDAWYAAATEYGTGRRRRKDPDIDAFFEKFIK